MDSPGPRERTKRGNRRVRNQKDANLRTPEKNASRAGKMVGERKDSTRTRKTLAVGMYRSRGKRFKSRKSEGRKT